MSFGARYSTLDRITHRLAFSNRAIRSTAMDIESSLYGRRFRDVPVRNPIFVTSLPRAGTTLLLEFLSSIPGVATHNYRDMPFVLAPVLWNQLSRSFRKDASENERAHGDGMLVGYDSPEAFEEVIWRFFWPGHFVDDRIRLWSDDEDPAEFRAGFIGHIQKIVALRLGTDAGNGRYVSKNNANIARIGFLRRLVPECRIVVPFRHPLDQAGSLLRQHQRFLRIHLEDPFARKYMDDIGHLEFGDLHRPIDFPGIDSRVLIYRPDSLEYWIAYWIAAFEHIVQHHEDIVAVSYENLCHRGNEAIEILSDALNLPVASRSLAQPALHAPRTGAVSTDGVTRDLLERAIALHQVLLAHSLV